MKAKETGQNMSFFSFPMGKSAKAKRRRSQWVEAIRRQAQGFVPTQNTKVCSRHFVFGIAISDPSSDDYILTVNMGYEKQRSTRRTETSTKARYWTNSDVAGVLDEEGKRRANGVAVPEIGAVTTVGIVEPSRKYSV